MKSGNKNSKIIKRFKKDFGVDLSDQDADKIVKLTKTCKFNELKEFIDYIIKQSEAER
jgi:cytidylate kinase